jgi:hypothetical protein
MKKKTYFKLLKLKKDINRFYLKNISQGYISIILYDIYSYIL